MSSKYEDISWLPVEGPRNFIESYGLGLLFSANVFGAGSVYILSNTGAQFGFTLLWTMPLALLVDMGMHEMSGRLATIDEPLMEYISDTIGSAAGKVLSVLIAFIMHFWAISNFAVGGAALAWLTPLDNVYIGIVLTAGVGIALVEMRIYERVEAAIAAVILTVFTIYILLVMGLDLPMGEVVSGLVPLMKTDLGYLATVVGLFGTTVYYPNFFIQSSMRPSKGWTDISYYRKDNFAGIAFVVLLSMSVIAVSALTLDPHAPTLTSPAEPLTSAVGAWALPVFVGAVFLASFSSATGTLFGAGFMVPQAWGKDTRFGDKWFRRTVEVLVLMSVAFAVLLLEFTAITPVQLGITMPAVNGLVGLPITALALYMANRKFFDHPLWMRVGFAVIVGLMFILAAMTAEGLYNQIIGWL
ncbi:NRAMP family divalent metal transporter [Haloarcula nitratireducens]|uniref:Divalent metal cation transporter n=1 Tax=Haloarcula nitratireducens TaxID=2487749 RepID=A0AAW4P799_9EURY|nr:divalent metal cation transporter [Halomicroarcula nitratireducens]MBX0293647.1 divalent metal cation transporter [Halomicroarcula nitratireducens]